MKMIWDKIGICASGLCLVHCLLTPILLIIFPAINATYLESEWFHLIIGVMVVTAALLAVLPHCRKHEHKDIILLAFIGSGLVVFALLADEVIGESLEHILTILGSMVLLSAHYKNIKVRHGRCEQTCEPHSHGTNSDHGHSHTH